MDWKPYIIRPAILLLAFAPWGTAYGEAPSPAYTRFDELLQNGVRRSVLTTSQSRDLRTRLLDLRLRDLRGGEDLEDALIQTAVHRGWLDRRRADALLEEKSRSAPPEGGEERFPWVERILEILPWIGGTALAIGLIWLLRDFFLKAHRLLQCSVAVWATVLFWYGAARLGAADWGATAATLSVAGCAASAAAWFLMLSWRKWDLGPRPCGFVLAVIWTPAACLLPSALVAYLAVAMVGLTFGYRKGFFQSRFDGRSSAHLAMVGLALTALGYGTLRWGLAAREPRVFLLVPPFWIEGLLGLFAAVGIRWEWRDFTSPHRIWTFLLGVASIGWGTYTREGIFVGAGGVALVCWLYTVLFEFLPRRLSTAACFFTTGVVTLVLTAGLDRHWQQVLALLRMRSY